MKLNSFFKLRFGLVCAGAGILGIFVVMLAISNVRFSSATDGGVVSIATVDTAVGLEMNSGTFNLDTSSSSATSSPARAISVYTNGGSGLSFKIGSTSNALVYKNSGTVEDTFTAFSGSKQLATIPDGTWGYAASTGSDCGTTYKGVPTTAADLISSSTFAAAGTYNVKLCIGAKGSSAKAAGIYAGQFTLSVTVNSAPVRYSVVYLDPDENGGASVLGSDTASESSASHSFTLNNSYTKQGYTLTGWKLDNAGTTVDGGTSVSVSSTAPTARYYAVWEAASQRTMQTVADWVGDLTVNEAVQAVDTRDNKTYWVTKLADGNVWMTQNLDLDLSASTALTSADSDVASSWTPTLSTYASTGTWTSIYNQSESYDPGDNYIPNGTGSATSAAGLASDSTDLHYHQGNYYNWNAATAGSDASAAEEGSEAAGSICPKGWRLPYAEYTRIGSKSWYYLVEQASITAENITTSPFYIPRAGIYNGTMDGVGSGGLYWSSDSFGGFKGKGLSFAFQFSELDISANSVLDAGAGFSVRCVARVPLTMQTVADWGSDLDEGDSVQAVDERDGKKYWVAKLADGNVWMTQNLDFDIDSSKTYTSTDTNLSSNWTPSTSTYTTSTTTWNYSTTTPESYDPGDVCWNGNLKTDWDGTLDTETVACTKSNMNYHIGNYYNWAAAVAMNDSSSYKDDGTIVTQSICPAGWTLPLSGFEETGSGSFSYLLDQYDIGGTQTMWGTPLSFVLGGCWLGSSVSVASHGYYWSSVVGDSGFVYFLSFNSGGYVDPQDSDARNNGFSVRCVAAP